MSFLTPYGTSRDWFRQNVNEMMKMADEFDTSFDPTMPNMLGTTAPSMLGRNRLLGSDAQRFMNLNVIENDKEFIVRCECAGVQKDKINLNIENNMLTIKATKEDCCKDSAAEPNVIWRCCEIANGTDTRMVRLPTNVDQDNVQCNCNDGLLCIKFPKKEVAGGFKKLQILS